MLSTTLLMAASLVAGQSDQAPAAEDHLKCLDAFLGKWVYKGPLQESVPDMAPEGTEIVVHSCYERILKGKVVENHWEILVQGQQAAAGKSLIGWHAKEKRIFRGGMGSDGGYGMAFVSVSDDGKTWTNENRGVDGEGKDVSSTVVMTLKDPDTLCWQAKNRKGGELTGDSPIYEFTRCTCDDEEDDEDDGDDDDDEDDEDDED